MSEKKVKSYKVRILAAVIETDENGNEEAEPAVLEIPVVATSFEQATTAVVNGLKKLVPQPMSVQDMAELMKMMKPQVPHGQLQPMWNPPHRDALNPPPKRMPGKAQRQLDKQKEEDIIETMKKFMKNGF